MLQYPSIPSWRYIQPGQQCTAFYKYDGSNLRFEWSWKRGWYKFGTRTQMMDQNTPIYGAAVPLFHETMGEWIAQRCQYAFGKKLERIVAFCEWFGPSSFAGWHDEDEKKQLVLLDVSIFKKGFLPPDQFLKFFDKADFCPKVIYKGPMNKQFVDDVRKGRYPVYEGVVCKGVDWNAKIKTLEYLERLKNENTEAWELMKDE